MRLLFFVCVSTLTLLGLAAAEARAQPKEVKVIKKWNGSVADEALQKMAPEFITTAKGLEELWKAWKVEGKVPDVDFAKEIVVIQTTVGSKISLLAKLDDKGNLNVSGAATLDLAPGFRYVIATVSREGVKTVNKKPLAKE
jgi:hypothetical protein